MLKMKTRVLLCAFLLLAFSMCQTRDSEKGRPISDTSENVPQLELEAYNGNIEAYTSLRSVFRREMRPGAFLFYAMMMVNKHDYAEAGVDVYYALLGECQLHGAENFKSIDKRTQKLLLQYLTEASTKGVAEADTILSDIKKGRR